MIIVNYYQHERYNPIMDGYELTLEGVINDTLDLVGDIPLILECIEDREYENDIIYEIHLSRAEEMGPHPARTPAFVIEEIVELRRNTETGEHCRGVVKL